MLGAALAPPRPAWAGGLRVAALDWALAATAVAVGARVVGVPAVDYYRRAVVEPALPADVVDVGLLFTPNFELLDELRPDLIVIPPGLRAAESLLARIAPVRCVDLAPDGGDALDNAVAATVAFADALGAREGGARLIADMERTFRDAAGALSARRGERFFIAMLADDRHLTLLGPGSLFDDVLGRLGLVNAQREPGLWGGRSVVGLDRLARQPEAGIVLIDADGENLAAPIDPNGVFWRALPAVRAGRVFHLPAVLDNGGAPAARRFATLLAAVLGKGSA